MENNFKLGLLKEELVELDKKLFSLLNQRFKISNKLSLKEGTSFVKENKDNLLSRAIIQEFLNLTFQEFKERVEKYKVKFIVASGPVIIEDGKLLVNKDDKDDFYKLPGGTIEEGEGDLEEACHREVKEENNAKIEIIRPLHPMILWKNPQTKESMAILLIHYLAVLKNKDEIKPMPPIQEVKWLDIEEIKQGKHNVAPNIKFLIEKGDIN